MADETGQAQQFFELPDGGTTITVARGNVFMGPGGPPIPVATFLAMAKFAHKASGGKEEPDPHRDERGSWAEDP